MLHARSACCFVCCTAIDMREHPQGNIRRGSIQTLHIQKAIFFSIAGTVKSLCSRKEFCFLPVLYVDRIGRRHGSGTFLLEGRAVLYIGILCGNLFGRCGVRTLYYNGQKSGKNLCIIPLIYNGQPQSMGQVRRTTAKRLPSGGFEDLQGL